MRRKIPVEELRIGMYLDGMDAKWFNTPFLKNHFLIKKEQQIKKIKDSGISHLNIDTEKGLDISNENEEVDRKTDHTSLLKKDDTLSSSKSSPVDSNKDVQQKENYLLIDKHTLFKGSFIDFSLFIKKGIIINPLIEFKQKDIEIQDSILNTEGEFVIDHKDIQKYKNYLKELVKRDAETSNQQIKNILIKESSKILMKELFDDPKSGDKIKECKGAVEGIIDGILSSRGIVSDLLTIDKFDYNLYAHSVNVSVLSVGIAIAIGIDKEKELFSIGMGSLLHDIGKSTISSEILNKPEERLTEMESKIMKQHVLEGNSLLKLFSGIPDDAFYPVLEHHEILSGSGYPHGLKGKDIHRSGRMTAIANLYDNLTTSSPYKKALQPFEALSTIRNKGEDYDDDIFKGFIKMLGNVG